MYLLSTAQVFSLVGLTQSHCPVPVISLWAAFIFSVLIEQKLAPVLLLVPCNHFYYTPSPKLDCSRYIIQMESFTVWPFVGTFFFPIWHYAFTVHPSCSYMGTYSFLPTSNISWCASATSFLPIALWGPFGSFFTHCPLCPPLILKLNNHCPYSRLPQRPSSAYV